MNQTPVDPSATEVAGPPSEDGALEAELGVELGPVILLVDDDPMLGQVVAACLDFEGAEVRTAHTVAAARALLDPSLAYVVLDRRLPDGDGLDLLVDLEERCPDVPVVVFTAYDDPSGTDLPHVDKSDIAALVDMLGLEPDHEAAVYGRLGKR
ncbi:MAG: sigma-54 dependent DNA-binding response regulator [Acidimicrobiales bacterium]|nr:sigma-54 dependent DNA-binding response regulator [Acidimicrobiales bacterium]